MTLIQRIKQMFTINRYDSVAYATLAIGMSNAIVARGIQAILNASTLDGHPTITHTVYHASYAAIAVADIVMASAINEKVKNVRKRRGRNILAGRPVTFPGKESYVRSAVMGTLGALAIWLGAGDAVARTRYISQTVDRAQSEIYVPAPKDTRSCHNETIQGTTYHALGCFRLRLEDATQMALPAHTEGLVISGFGPRRDPVTGEENMEHMGLDIITDNVYAAHRGQVTHIGNSNSPRQVGNKQYTVGGDTCIDVQMYKPEGYAADERGEEPFLNVRSRYCCVTPRVTVGEFVDSGEVIGLAMPTCTENMRLENQQKPYVHFMLEMGDPNGKGNIVYTPVDPLTEAMMAPFQSR